MVPRLRVVLDVLALLVVGCSVWLLWGPIPVPSESWERRSGAVWLGHAWLEGRGSVSALAARAQEQGITELYVHVGPLDAHGKIPDHSVEAWRRTAALLRIAVPGVRIHAWLGGLTTFRLGRAADTIDLADVSARSGIVQTAARLIRQDGFDGIHYDLELIADGDPWWLLLLQETREAVRPALLAADTPNLRFAPLDNLWSEAYLRAVATRCDEVTVMAYDTAMPTETAYARLLAWEVPRLCKAVHGTGARLRIGVPTYDQWSWSHFPAAETPGAARLGIRTGLDDAIHRQHIDTSAYQGVAVYAEWTTDAVEWEALGRQ